jgi:DNA adenine methylase
MTAIPVSASVIRWAGSKRRLLPRLAQYWSEDCTRYVEPFVGSAALFFLLRPGSAILGDINGELVNALAQLSRHPKRLHSSLVALPRSRRLYEDYRRQSPMGLSRFDRAVRFFYLNRYCFNGLYRTNTQGRFNVPYAPARSGRFPPIERFVECGRLLRRASLREVDFEELIRAEVGRADFVYLDPPYAVANRRLFRQYGPDTFGLQDIDRLGSILQHIDSVGARFVLSYADSVEARRLFGKWYYRRVRVQRNVAGFAASRRGSVEVLISNAVPPTTAAPR